MGTEGTTPIRLTREAWLAIYYGLAAARRELDRDRAAGIWDESLAECAEFLRGLQARIGVDGEAAHRRGTRGIDALLRWMQRAIVETVREHLSEI